MISSTGPIPRHMIVSETWKGKGSGHQANKRRGVDDDCDGHTDADFERRRRG